MSFLFKQVPERICSQTLCVTEILFWKLIQTGTQGVGAPPTQPFVAPPDRFPPLAHTRVSSPRIPRNLNNQRLNRLAQKKQANKLIWNPELCHVLPVKCQNISMFFVFQTNKSINTKQRYTLYICCVPEPHVCRVLNGVLGIWILFDRELVLKNCLFHLSVPEK